MPDVPMSFAHWLTILGQAEVVWPIFAVSCLWFARTGATRLAVAWLVSAVAVVGITVASKVAFLGWCIGSPVLDFTGISGHALSAATVYPVLFRGLAGDATSRLRDGVTTAGYALALAIAISRLIIGAHSPAEAAAGFALGSAASAATLWFDAGKPLALPAWALLPVALWMSIMPTSGPPSHSHSMITQLALRLSHRSQPYTRADLRRRITALRACLGAPGIVDCTPGITGTQRTYGPQQPVMIEHDDKVAYHPSIGDRISRL